MPLLVLLTGFEPFGGASYNPSGETALALDNTAIPAPTSGGMRTAHVHGVRLPVLWERSAALVQREIQSINPHVVICLGEGDTTYRVEQFADDVRVSGPDNSGHGPRWPRKTRSRQLPTRLPRVSLEAAMSSASGGNVSPSVDAGGYICNQVFYELMRLLQGPAMQRRIFRAGFIHVPNHTVVPSSIAQSSVNAVIEVAIRVTAQDLTAAEYARTQP
jgi:pyroglutamyl-peptidase